MQKRLSPYIEGWLIVALAAAVVLGMVSFASAALSSEGTQPQSSKRDQGKDKDKGITDTDLHEFDHFADKHRDISMELRKNPDLVNDTDWVNNHPELKDWLEDHPKIRDKFKANPKEFMRKEIEWDKQEAKKHHPKKPQ
jgi:hypothetical protein